MAIRFKQDSKSEVQGFPAAGCIGVASNPRITSVEVYKKDADGNPTTELEAVKRVAVFAIAIHSKAERIFQKQTVIRERENPKTGKIEKIPMQQHLRASEVKLYQIDIDDSKPLFQQCYEHALQKDAAFFDSVEHVTLLPTVEVVEP